ncbi:11366_t:CDS:2, partial [Entrophospora sp. SA101]
DINNAIDQKSNIIEDGINFVKNLIKEIEIDASQPLDDNTGSNILSPSYNPISNGSISLTSTLTPTPITTTITTVTNDVDTSVDNRYNFRTRKHVNYKFTLPLPLKKRHCNNIPIRNDDSRNDSNAIGLTPGYLDPNNQSRGTDD